MKKWYQKIGIFLLQVICITVLIVGISIAKDGMYLLGVPNVDHVNKVTIAYPEKTDGILEITNREQIERAVKLTGFLRYALFAAPDLSDDAKITITYYADGKEPVSVSANGQTVWWQGKAHALKDKDFFVNLTEGIFYFDGNVEK